MPTTPVFTNRPRSRALFRVPAHILVSLLIVAVTAGVLLAARREAPSPVSDQTLAIEVPEETPLPTPVPLASATPLPTPVPTKMGQGTIVDTATTFYGVWLPAPGADTAPTYLGGVPGDGRGVARSSASPSAASPSAAAAAAATPAPRSSTAAARQPATPAPVVVVPTQPRRVVTPPPVPVPVPTLPPVPLPTPSVPGLP